ncbi:MAG: serine hydrolase domain-containing protein [Ginsengibacter sp.]
MNILKNYWFLLVILFFLFGCSSGSADKLKGTARDSVTYSPQRPGVLKREDSLRFYNAIQSFYETLLLAHGFNGAILVAKKGVIIFEKYHGFSNQAKKDTLNENSSFHIASVSKTFTAMATLKLVELGKLKLDENIKTWFPSLPYEGITLRMLLSHRSGLPNYLYFMQQLGWDVKKYVTNAEVLNYLVTYKPPITHSPGTHFSYCNTNYALLALIIEKVSGKTYPDFLQFTFFTPLQMNNTYVFSLADSARSMQSYDWRGRPERLTFLDGGYGDKNIYSSARDLLKWDQSMYNNQLFSKETLQEAFTPYSNEKPGIKNYGFGWRMNLYPNGKKVIFHTGWWHGNNCILMRLIEDSATIIVLGNKYNRSIYQAKQLANIFQPYFGTEEEDQAENVKDDVLPADHPDSSWNTQARIHSTVSKKRHR